MSQKLINAGLDAKENLALYQDTSDKWTKRVGLTDDLLDDDGSGGKLIKTSAIGEFTFSGLKTGGRVSEVTINDTTWTALPAIALTGRNAIAIQNDSAVKIKINYDSGVAGFVGITIPAGGERQYDITDAIIIYAKSESGNVPINVEELA